MNRLKNGSFCISYCLLPLSALAQSALFILKGSIFCSTEPMAGVTIGNATEREL